MKKILNIIVTISLLIITISCQEVVDVDLETSQERLVIEALLKWEQGTTGNNQTIKLSKTSSFYNNQFLPVTGADVILSNTSSSAEFLFTDNNDGTYTINNFIPVLHDIYTLEINYNNETYTAESKLLQAPEILGMSQSTEGGFSIEEPEINISFQDFINQDDFYRIIFKHYRPSINNELIADDIYAYDARFEENNILEDWYENDNIEVGDEFHVQLYKISEQFFTFLAVLDQQANARIGPFASPPVNVKGNCINTTNSENYPYGYFSLNEVSSEFYIFE